MREGNYHELNPLIRVKETELISSELMERMAAADSVQEVGEMLKSTVYAPYINEQFEYHFEESLQRHREELFAELGEIAPEPGVVWIYTMRYTFHNLKILTKSEYTDQDLSHLFIYDGFYSKDVLQSAIRTGVSSQLPESVMASINEVREYIEESNILQGIDIIYDRSFLKEQRRLGEELGHPELLKEIIAFIDLTNITIAARGITQNRSRGFMTTVLSSSGSIPKEDFLDYAEGEIEPYIDFLLASDYRDYLQPALVDHQISFKTLERLKDDSLTEMFDEAQTQAFGPLPLLAFLNAKEIEAKNLRLIVVGKRSGFTQEQIKERMRQVNDL